MKINQEMHVKLDKMLPEQKQSVHGHAKFHDLVKKNGQKLQVQQLEKMLGEIESAGERLSRSRTFKDLAKFKTLVKNFIRETVDYGMGLKRSHGWNQFGQGQSLKIVETIDEKLVELTADIVNKEEKAIDILGKVGEIKGLLINLYM